MLLVKFFKCFSTELKMDAEYKAAKFRGKTAFYLPLNPACEKEYFLNLLHLFHIGYCSKAEG